MNKAIFGDQIDIHGGGIDLIFPHHENEIAQSEALSNKTFSTFWVHHNFIVLVMTKCQNQKVMLFKHAILLINIIQKS